MIILDTTLTSLEIDLVSAITTNQLPVVSSFVDIGSSNFGVTEVGSQDTASNDTTAATIVTAPASGKTRQIKTVFIQNQDTVAATVIVQLNNDSTLRQLIKVTLQPDETLQYVDGAGWDFAGKKNIDAVIANPLTAFGEVSTAEPTPKVQVQFQYNLNTDVVEVRANHGTASVENNMLKLSTGAAANQSAQLLSKVPVKYGPGQGALTRFTGVFTAGAANSTQYIGIGTIGDGFFFGFNGTNFGIMSRKGGVPKIETFTVTTASNTAENITITLDGDAVSDVTVSAAGADSALTRTVTANEIAAHDYSDIGKGWDVHAVGPNVIFESYGDGAKTGTFSLSSATTAVASVAETLAGVTATDTAVAEASWSNPPPFTIDPTKGNVFQIRYQWLGFGMVSFYIENPVTGSLTLVHKIEYANANTTPSINNPTLPLCALVKNASNTTDIILRSGSVAGFIEGRDTNIGVTHSASVEFTNIGTTETPILSIHNHTIFQNVLNRVNVELLAVSIAVEGTKPSTYKLTKGTTLTGAAFVDFDSNTSVVRVDSTATVLAGGNVEFTDGLAKVDSTGINLKDFGLEMEVKETYTLSLKASQGSVDGVATIVWKEHF